MPQKNVFEKIKDEFVVSDAFDGKANNSYSFFCTNDDDNASLASEKCSITSTAELEFDLDGNIVAAPSAIPIPDGIKSDLTKEDTVNAHEEPLQTEILPDANQIDSRPSNTANVMVRQKKDRSKGFKCIGNGCELMFSFNNPGAYRLHKQMPHECPLCKKISTNVYQLYNHNKRMHSLDRKKKDPVNCDICGKTFTMATNLHRHKKHVHEKVKPFQCDICKTFFGRLQILESHMDVHMTERRYECTDCGHKFKSVIRLKLHGRTEHRYDDQSGYRKKTEIVCELCGKIFKNKLNFITHIRKHNNDRQFACEFCDKAFLSKNTLDNHTFIHTGVKRFECTMCDGKFAMKGQLTVHMLTHTGERPHKCKLCDSSFTQTGHLRYHMLTHTGEKPYGCTICGNRFANPANLKIHTRLHTGERPYHCTYCGGNFVGKGALNKHKCRTNILSKTN